jgi:hypothetical protein
MASIYSSAKQVIIWLGRYREPEDDELLFDRETLGFDSLESGSFETTQKAFEPVEYAMCLLPGGRSHHLHLH